MSGTVVTTEQLNGKIKRVAFDWLSSSDGEASATTTAGINGKLLSAVFVPDSGGTAPDDLYDATLTDANSLDLLAGQGANLSGTNTIVINSNLLPVPGNRLTRNISGAGEANGGLVYLLLEE